ncbi:uncharacterized protein VP01_475g5 [Puccinia sorghi]|uniref:Uncharacterized protein n=1 Tax=Puccinia sorghi TaxID=27349 RepID=A0A0L6UNI2_9BASI|nr:uncharacterized protein VP01_475g5 [Puccinia sorghi]
MLQRKLASTHPRSHQLPVVKPRLEGTFLGIRLINNISITSSSSSVTPQQNSKLVQHYLRVLKLRKEEYIRNYKPTDWELLTREEQLISATYHAHLCEKESLETQLLINQYNSKKKEKKRLSDKESQFLYLFQIHSILGLMGNI